MLLVMGIRESAFHLDGSTCISIDTSVRIYILDTWMHPLGDICHMQFAVLHVYVAAMTYYIHIRTINKLGKSMT